MKQEIQEIIEAGYSPQQTARNDTKIQCYNPKEVNSTKNPKEQEIDPALHSPEREHRLTKP